MSRETLETARSFVERHGFLSWLGVTVAEVGDGRVVLTVPATEDLRNVGDEGLEPVHGGVVATLVDTASGFALRTTFPDPTEARLTTTDLDVSYLRPALGDLRATGEVVRAGRSMGVVDVTVTASGGAGDPNGDGEDRKVAVGRATYRLFREED